jgi:hypothetical protein
MNLEENKLDDLFREKLINFAPEPPTDMWNRISKEMNRKKSARRIIIYRWMGAAAVILLAMITGILVTQNDTTLPVKDISKQISTNPKGSTENLPVQKTIEININKLFKTEAQKSVSVIDHSSADSVYPVDNQNRERVNYLAVTSGMTSVHEPEITLNRSLAENTIIIRRDFKTPSGISSPFDDQKILALETVGSNKKDKTALEWKVGVQLAPAYSSHASGYTTNYSRAMMTTGKTAQTGMGGGISIQVKTSRRWTIESGLYYSRSGDKSSSAGQLLAANADFTSLAGGNKYFNSAVVYKDGLMIMNGTAGVIRFSQTPDNAKFISGAESAIGMNTVLLMSGDFSQVFDFMEMPLTTRYRLIDGKIDLELLSGLSANFVVGNQVIMENASTRDYVGKTEDISRLGFSGVAGFGVIYPLSKRISITIEPRASYWLSSLNNSSEVDFRPWRIGIYSGLTFGF